MANVARFQWAHKMTSIRSTHECNPRTPSLKASAFKFHFIFFSFVSQIRFPSASEMRIEEDKKILQTSTSVWFGKSLFTAQSFIIHAIRCHIFSDPTNCACTAYASFFHSLLPLHRMIFEFVFFLYIFCYYAAIDVRCDVSIKGNFLLCIEFDRRKRSMKPSSRKNGNLLK